MADLVIVLGLITGLLAGGTIYWSRKRWGIKVIGAVFAFLTVGTPLHFLILHVAAGIWVNRRLYCYRESNRLAFLASLPGVIGIYAILSVTGRLYLTIYAAGPMGLGAALAKGIAMGMFFAILGSSVVYILASEGASLWRWKRS